MIYAVDDQRGGGEEGCENTTGKASSMGRMTLSELVGINGWAGKVELVPPDPKKKKKIYIIPATLG
jgi:hypothetical protein